MKTATLLTDYTIEKEDFTILYDRKRRFYYSNNTERNCFIRVL